MSDIPGDLKFLSSHEWVRIEADGSATVGISDHAQDLLGDIVFIELPKVGKIVKAGEQVGVVESVKAASELYSPISGEIIKINDILSNEPQIINTDAENTGWYMKVKIDKTDELESLMNIDQYKNIIK